MNHRLAVRQSHPAKEIQKVLAKLADLTNQKTLIIPVEVTGVLGSLAGIAEMPSRRSVLMLSQCPTTPSTAGPDGPTTTYRMPI